MQRRILGVLVCWLALTASGGAQAPIQNPYGVVNPVPDFRPTGPRPAVDPRARAVTPRVDLCAGRADGVCAEPMWDGGMTYLGSFIVPPGDGAGGMLSYGCRTGACGASLDNTAFYWSCSQRAGSSAVYANGEGWAKLRVPSLGGRAQVLETCRGLGNRDLMAIIPADPNAWRPQWGGVVETTAGLCQNAYIEYDAGGQAAFSHWCGPTTATVQGPRRISDPTPTNGTLKTGYVKQYNGRIPTRFQAALGGDAFGTAGYGSIVARSLYGGGLTVYSVADLMKGDGPGELLVGCPHEVPSCVTWLQDRGVDNLYYYSGAENAGGSGFVPGTRSFVQIEKESDKNTCYGYATRDKALHRTPYPNATNPSPEKVTWCWSTEPLDQKGMHFEPDYKLVAKVYDVADMIAVKAGIKKPWDVNRPVAVYPVPNVPYPSYNLYGGAGWMDDNGRLFVNFGAFGGDAAIHVWQLGQGGQQPPPPTHTRARAIGADSAWQPAWVANAKATLAAGAQKLSGKVLHVGDSMTVSQAYGAWAIGAAPAGATAEDLAALAWMRAGKPAPENGWHLSWQAVTARDSLSWQSSLIDGLLTDARTRDAQYVVWQLHTPDADPRTVSAVEARIRQFAAAGIVSVLTTVPPRVGAGYDDTITKPYNAALRALAQRMGVPLIDLYDEIVQRRPNGTWANTLIDPDGVHLSGRAGGYDWASNPYTPGGNADGSVTGDATLHSGYLLRTWLTAAKLGQIHALVGTAVPVDCVGAWGAWGRVAGSESACAEGSRTYRERRDFTVTTPASGGGMACPASPETRTQTEQCDTPVDPCLADPVLVSGIAWPGISEGARSGRFVWAVSGAAATLAKVEWLWAPQRLTVTDSRGCSATVTR